MTRKITELNVKTKKRLDQHRLIRNLITKHSVDMKIQDSTKMKQPEKSK